MLVKGAAGSIYMDWKCFAQLIIDFAILFRVDSLAFGNYKAARTDIEATQNYIFDFNDMISLGIILNHNIYSITNHMYISWDMLEIACPRLNVFGWNQYSAFKN